MYTQYDGIRDEQHLVELMTREPIWGMLEDEFFVQQLSQIHNHYDVVSAYAPKSIEELAVIIALIRPGKRHLQGMEMEDIKKDIWVRPKEGYFFKKSHAVSYAAGIVVADEFNY